MPAPWTAQTTIIKKEKQKTESEGGRNTVRYRGHSRDKIALP